MEQKNLVLVLWEIGIQKTRKLQSRSIAITEPPQQGDRAPAPSLFITFSLISYTWNMVMISSSNSFFLFFSRIFLGGCGGGGVWDLFGDPLFIRLEEGRMISGCVSFPTMLLEAERKEATFRFNQGNGSCNLVRSKLDRTSLKPGRLLGRPNGLKIIGKTWSKFQNRPGVLSKV